MHISSGLIFRKTILGDIPEIINMLADDILGRNREILSEIEIYENAFNEIDKSKNDFLAVIENREQKIIATCHLTLMPSLTLRASKRMNIEGVRVAKDFRGRKVGEFMFKKAIEFAKENGVKIIQLSTNKERNDAKRFYESCGFVASHEGMKMVLM